MSIHFLSLLLFTISHMPCCTILCLEDTVIIHYTIIDPRSEDLWFGFGFFLFCYPPSSFFFLFFFFFFSKANTYAK